MFIVSHLVQRIRPEHSCSYFLFHLGRQGRPRGGGSFGIPIPLDDVDEKQ